MASVVTFEGSSFVCTYNLLIPCHYSFKTIIIASKKESSDYVTGHLGV